MSTNEQTTRDQTESTDTTTNVECPECGGDVRPDDDIDQVCSDCGLVVDRDDIDRGPEWRGFDDGQLTSRRCGGSSTSVAYHDDRLGSQIGWPGPLPSAQLGRMRRLNGRRDRSYRTSYDGLVEVKNLVGALEVGGVGALRERAAKVFRDAQEAGLLLGRSIDAGAAAAVWVACREMDLPVRFADIVDASPEHRGVIRATFKAVTDTLGCYSLPPLPSELVARVASDVDVPPAVEREALSYAHRAEAAGVHVGRKPSGLAAACVLHAAETVEGADKLTQKSVADVAGVSTVTVRRGQEAIRTEVVDSAE